MASILDTIASEVAKGFKGKLRTGTLIRRTYVSGSQNASGDPTPATPLEYSCEGFTDRYSDFIRGRDGIPDTDLMVCIFGRSLPSGVRPRKDDTVQFAGLPLYQLRRADTDPATALWICRAYELR